ncbi:MAG TPA: bifunctional nuclease family protein, partial [Candidatus Omnitrophica bacterium]|nr:bifunctional nuclease family protein [Candidatus Omnitrophota bacterium]
VTADNDVVSVDARPSDGIAVAVRTGAPMYVEDDIFEKAAFYKPE